MQALGLKGNEEERLGLNEEIDGLNKKLSDFNRFNGDLKA